MGSDRKIWEAAGNDICHFNRESDNYGKILYVAGNIESGR